MEFKDLPEFMNSVLWPLVILIIYLSIRPSVIALLKKSKNIKIKVPGGTEISLSLDQAESVMQNIVENIEELIKDLTNCEKFVLKKLSKEGSSEVIKLFPEFFRSTNDKQSEYHEALRALRKKNIVKPVEGGRFKPDKIIEITPFGQLVWRLKRDSISI